MTIGGILMKFVKCPRCELNYIQEDEQYCSVCKREMKGDVKDDPFELCSVCGENPAIPGKDVCLFCLKEMGKQDESADEGGSVSSASELEMDSVTGMDEIELDVDSDIPEPEMGEIDSEFSLEEKAEEEEEEAEEADKDGNDY